MEEPPGEILVRAPRPNTTISQARSARRTTLAVVRRSRRAPSNRMVSCGRYSSQAALGDGEIDRDAQSDPSER